MLPVGPYRLDGARSIARAASNVLPDTYRNFGGRWLGALGLVILAGCGSETSDPAQASVAGTDSTELGPSTKETRISSTTQAKATVTTVGVLGSSEELVVERRPPTDDEMNRLDDDGRGGPLDCAAEDAGAGAWEWEEIGPDDPTGRVSDAALRDAIAATSPGMLPKAGWTELTFSPNRSTFVHSIVNDDWRAIVTVGGDPELGVWRQFDFSACAPIAHDSNDL
jgi:hypothetical protein